MRKLLILALFFPIGLMAQVSNPSIIVVGSAPSGACTANLPDQQVIMLGTIYTCQSGTWTMIGSGGGGAVSSVFGRTGTVVAVSADYSAYYLTLSGGTMAGPLNTATEYSNGTCTTTATISAANGNHQKVTLTNGDTCALTFTQPSSGTITITLKIIQSATSTYNGAISGCKWPGGTVPTITATTGAVDFITAYLDGTNAYCVASQNFE